MALKPENGAFFANLRPQNAGCKQKQPKMASFLQDLCIDGLPAAERRGFKTRNTTKIGVWRLLNSLTA